MKKSQSFDSSIANLDTYIGKRLKSRRGSLNISQTNLGKSIGVTFQQIQKYEKGANRISASKLFEISRKLCTPMSYFFDNFDNNILEVEEDKPIYELENSKKKETIELLRAYYKIFDPLIRKKILEIIRRFNSITTQSP